MSFANQEAGLSSLEFDKAKLIFDRSMRGNDNQTLRQIMLGEDKNGNNRNNSTAQLMGPLMEDGGVVFDYTPSITINYVTSYTPLEIVHGNYDYFAFQKAGIGEIYMTVPITAETREKANRLLAIIHFLRTFTKMNFGINDDLQGLPPRLLRFFAYGDYMINNVPVAIKNFSIVLGNEVDYVQTDFNTQVPLKMEFSISMHLMPTPSRIKREFNLQEFASGKLIKKGYL